VGWWPLSYSHTPLTQLVQSCMYSRAARRLSNVAPSRATPCHAIHAVQCHRLAYQRHPRVTPTASDRHHSPVARSSLPRDHKLRWRRSRPTQAHPLLLARCARSTLSCKRRSRQPSLPQTVAPAKPSLPQNRSCLDLPHTPPCAQRTSSAAVSQRHVYVYVLAARPHGGGGAARSATDQLSISAGLLRPQARRRGRGSTVGELLRRG